MLSFSNFRFHLSCIAWNGLACLKAKCRRQSTNFEPHVLRTAHICKYNVKLQSVSQYGMDNEYKINKSLNYWLLLKHKTNQYILGRAWDGSGRT